MKRKLFQLATILAVLFTISSCTDLPDVYKEKPTEPEQPGGEVTPEFDWKITEGLTLEVKVKTLEGKVNDFYRTVKVFTDKNFESTSLIATGSARPGEPYTTEISVPAAVKVLYIQVRDAYSRSTSYKCEISLKQGTLVLDTNTAQAYEPDPQTRAGNNAPAAPGITLPDTYDYTVTTAFPDGLENGKTYYIPKGVTIELDNKNVLENGIYVRSKMATIYVAGTLKIKETSAASISNKHFVVLPGGKIEAPKMTFIKIANKDIPVVYVMAGGEMDIAGDLSVADNLSLVNHGIINCKKFNTYGGSHVHIAGLLKVYQLNLAWPKEWPDSYVYMYPNAVIDAQGSAWLGKAHIIMYEEAIFYSATNTPAENAKFIAPEGNKAFVRIDGQNYTYGGMYTFYGDIEVFIPNIKASHAQAFRNERMFDGAFLTDNWEDRKYYIAWTEINNGYGEFELMDKDGDGVPSHEDIDDTDPNAAYNSYFPSASDMATMMFEDNWPGRGDYDMNDVVVDFNVYWATNAQNQATGMTVQWKLRAAGAQNKLAMALQLDGLAVGAVSAVESTLSRSGSIFQTNDKGLETGQSHPVIPLFDDVSDVFGSVNKMVNTYQGQTYYNSNTETLTIHFASPVAMRNVAESQLNFFVVASSHENPTRHREIHFPWQGRTDLGKKHTTENTDPDNEYLTVDGMMWGIMVPRSIKYPREGVIMEDAYPAYGAWYKSNGAQNEDWYLNGQVNEEKVYQVPVEEIPEEDME